jgi:hypothetical protein
LEPIDRRGIPGKTVIFLDIDGVLNRERTEERIGEYTGLDEELVRRFLRVVRRTGADVVLSSTWRLERDMKAAVQARIRLTDATDADHGSRGEQIARWLSAHQEYERHAVLDDERDMIAGLSPFFTNPRIGLSPKIADDVVEHLTPQRWVHIEPSRSCARVEQWGRGGERERCGRALESHPETGHQFLAPIVELDHAPIAPNQGEVEVAR